MKIEIGGWKSKTSAGLAVGDAFDVFAEKIYDYWYFAFEKGITNLKISEADFSMKKWDGKRIERKIAKLMVRHDIAQRILNNIFGRL